jgi:hypothetical protein
MDKDFEISLADLGLKYRFGTEIESKKDFYAVHDLKLKEIGDCFISLLNTYYISNEFKNSQDLDFKKSVETNINKLKDATAAVKRIFGENNFYLSFFGENWTESFSKNLGLLLDDPISYTPPEDVLDSIEHLATILFYFNNIRNYPPNLIDMKLDVSLLKLINACGRMQTILQYKGEREASRTKKSNAEIKKKRSKTKELISKAIFKCSIQKGTTVNEAVGLIHGKLTQQKKKREIPESTKIPCKDTIRSYLKDESIITELKKLTRD